jgi:apolipoprotein N-acyltransferase
MALLGLIEKLKSARGFSGFLLSFILGAACNLGHAPFFIWPVFVLCFALFVFRLDGSADVEKPLRSGFWRGLSFGLGYFLFGFYWIGSAFIARGPEFVPFMPLAVFLFVFGLALFWGVAGCLYVKMTKGSQGVWRSAVFACIFFLTEYLRGHLFGGLPWNLPGYIFKAGGAVSQSAAFVGIYGISALVFIVIATLAPALDPQRTRYKPIAAGLIILTAVWGFGTFRLGNANVEYVENVTLRIVHANILQRDKFDPNKYVEIANQYLNLSRSEGFEDVTHIIWPEGAIPGLMFRDLELMRAIDDLFKSGPGQPPVFITQTLRAEHKPDAIKPNYYNAAAAVTFVEGGPPQISGFYDKRKLVPFGEFIPGGGLLEKIGLTSLSSALESMTPGTTGIVPNVPGLPPVSIQICYEIIFPGFTPKIVPGLERKPEWILNLSNDSWYGNSTGPRQHINQVGYRAIEEALPIIRSTSGGISGLIDPYGRMVASRNLDENAVLDVPLPQAIGQNSYDKMLNHIIALIILAMLVTYGWGTRHRVLNREETFAE